MSEKPIRVWLTRYALTTGIEEVRGTVSPHHPKGFHILPDETPYATYVYKPDWHLSHVEAVARAEQMRMRKIASLEKQLARLKALKFS